MRIVYTFYLKTNILCGFMFPNTFININVLYFPNHKLPNRNYTSKQSHNQLFMNGNVRGFTNVHIVLVTLCVC